MDLFVDLGQEFMIPKQVVLILSNFHGAATVLRDQNLVAFRHAHGYSLSILVESAGSHGQNLCLVQLLDAALREEDSTGRSRLGLHSLDQDTVQQRNEGSDALECGGLDNEALAYCRPMSNGEMRAPGNFAIVMDRTDHIE